MANSKCPACSSTAFEAKVKTVTHYAYINYEQEMKLEESFELTDEFLADFPALALGATSITNPKYARLVFIESKGRSDFFELEYELSGQKAPNGAAMVTLIVRKKGWQKA